MTLELRVVVEGQRGQLPTRLDPSTVSTQQTAPGSACSPAESHHSYHVERHSLQQQSAATVSTRRRWPSFTSVGQGFRAARNALPVHSTDSLMNSR